MVGRRFAGDVKRRLRQPSSMGRHKWFRSEGDKRRYLERKGLPDE